ncbi:TonB-linked outer membrane protein, SusC/RagA family [Cnuella takakiae]|uniref:TonB-linked outer membrane protein, SusC/RagA family n=1 Tax=Cnuella takakiae TaxID=1302690 RepID=A0A1M4T3A4_9BACT|nr:TonB-dependent receptor [Cnuella takakiae]OLY90673.1 SusC/RagA family TonB-linked outer membrane protein [Cnuella takakiae]SHE39012.1 TonB-linked outer membrane protein, SusC/RagA family [Cnuella takakiae]
MKKTASSQRLPKLAMTAFFALLLSGSVWAQTVKVSGTIANQRTASGLSGATITVKGTTRTTTADDAGRFTIDAAPGEVLVVTSVGYTPREVKVDGAGTVSVQLQEAENRMEEVVVIGYGTQKRRLVTGSNLSVRGEDIQRQSTTSALQALQGQAPGVQITAASGQPGSGTNVVIRGKGTIGNASPLYIVDGVYTNDISYLNPADIQSIDVLKDAASAAIYGSQAANGVILVTTRTGRANQKAQVTLDAFYGVQNPPRKAQLLNAREYATIQNEAAVNSGKAPYFTNEQIANLPVNTNWLDQMFVKNAPTQNYVLGVQGGGGGSTYSTSLSYTGQQGIVGGKSLSNFERYTFRINSEHNLYQNIIKLGQHLTFNYQENNGIGVGNQYNNALRAAFNTSPFVPMYDSLGNFYDNSNSTWYNGEANPYAAMYYGNQNRNNNQRLFGDIYVQVEPIKGLRFRSSMGVNYYASENRSFTPIYRLSIYSFNNNTVASQGMGRNRNIQFDNLLSYSFKVGGQHNFETMVGNTAIRTTGSGIFGSNRNLVFSDLEHAWLSNATNTEGTLMSITGSPYEEALASYFGRVQYNYNEKYLFNATFRADGSSRFAPGSRWGYFPSVSLGWVATRERFLENVEWLNFLKLRASWGQVGNQNITNNQYLAPVSFNNATYTFGNAEGTLIPGAYPSRLGNPDLKWETSEQTNLGFDATLNRNINVTFDYYVKNTKDWLLVAPVLATAGADAPYINGGNVRNEGVELAINYRNRVGEFNYSVGVNGAYNKNRIGNIPTLDQIIHGNNNALFDNSLEFYRAQNGFPVGYFWGLKTDGVFQTEEEVRAFNKGGQLVQPNAQPGDVRFVDRNGDGIINDADRTMIGDPNPDFTFGLSLNADYKGFDFSLLAAGVAGNEIVQSWRNHANARANYSAAILDRWVGPGSSNRMPRVTEDNRNWTQFSDLFIHKGDFLRINNITVGYDFAKVLQKPFLSKVRLYASVLNLYTFTNYNGMDPEIGYGESFSSGVDLGYYPRPRTLMVGANIRF